MGEVLDLNSSIEKESEFIDVPEGEYDATIDHVESAVCQWTNDYNGNPMRNVFVNIHLPDGNDAQLREGFVLNSDFEWKLAQLFLSTGQKKKGEVMPNLGRALNELAGRNCRVRVKKTPRKDDPEKTYTNLTFLERKQVGWGGGGF